MPVAETFKCKVSDPNPRSNETLSCLESLPSSGWVSAVALSWSCNPSPACTGSRVYRLKGTRCGFRYMIAIWDAHTIAGTTKLYAQGLVLENVWNSNLICPWHRGVFGGDLSLSKALLVDCSKHHLNGLWKWPHKNYCQHLLENTMEGWWRSLESETNSSQHPSTPTLQFRRTLLVRMSSSDARAMNWGQRAHPSEVASCACWCCLMYEDQHASPQSTRGPSLVHCVLAPGKPPNIHIWKAITYKVRHCEALLCIDLRVTLHQLPYGNLCS